MEVKDIKTAQGHWLLAKMGKKVLRPGGRELTYKLIKDLEINKNDKIIEFAPGLGFTANLSIKKHPRSYTGVDADEGAVELLQNKFRSENGTTLSFIKGDAENVNLSDGYATKLYGEAMLTMHSDQRKKRIIKEAHRLLETGGLYAIHEIGLIPDNISDELKSKIQKDLAKTIRVNARPLTIKEWKTLLEEAGFDVICQGTNGMYLLKTKRIIQDEGFLNTLKIAWNVLSNNAARKRIFDMYKVFNKYEKYMNAIVLVARKK